MYVFFCNALYIHSPDEIGITPYMCPFDFAQDHELVEWHLFETPLNGPLFWAIDKKRHTYAPSQVLGPSFWR
jgi:hypothetical protein